MQTKKSCPNITSNEDLEPEVFMFSQKEEQSQKIIDYKKEVE